MDPDAELVIAIARGDRAALGSLYDKYATFLMSLAIRIVRERREAEDLLHDVFLEVWRSAVDYDPARGKVRTWLAVRMRSRCLDRQKSARVSRQSGDESVLDRVAAEPGPAGEIDAGPDRARVRTALGALSDDQRQVIELAYFDGLSCSEIAASITVPIGTVKSRMAAAMTKLRAALGDAGSIATRPDARAKGRPELS